MSSAWSMISCNVFGICVVTFVSWLSGGRNFALACIAGNSRSAGNSLWIGKVGRDRRRTGGDRRYFRGARAVEGLQGKRLGGGGAEVVADLPSLVSNSASLLTLNASTRYGRNR